AARRTRGRPGQLPRDSHHARTGRDGYGRVREAGEHRHGPARDELAGALAGRARDPRPPRRCACLARVRPRRLAPVVATTLTAAVLVAGCSGAGGEPSPGPLSSAPSSRPSASPSTSTGTGTASPEASEGAPPSPAAPDSTEPTSDAAVPDDELAGWSLEQKVGQLLMVGIAVDGPAAVSAEAVRDDHVGNVFL